MSSNYSDVINFKHTVDCTQAGCPGHKMQLKTECTSETMAIIIDGYEHLIFQDEFEAAAILYLSTRSELLP